VYVVTFGSAGDTAALAAEGFEIGKIIGTRVEVLIRGSADPLVKALAAFEIIDLESRPMTLEQVFMQYYGKEETT